MRLRRRSVLSYEVPRLEGLAGVSDAMVRMTGRRSVAEWRRRCEASLVASRRRRGKRTDVVVVLRVEDRASPALADVAARMRRLP